MNHWTPDYGWPFPQGCAWDPVNKGYNFALYSKDASSINLLFFNMNAPDRVVFTFPFDVGRNKLGAIWACFLKEEMLHGADCYAYQVNGSGDPGNRFDPAKMLLDPWAKSIYFPPAFSRQAAVESGSNMGKAPLALLVKSIETVDILAGDIRPQHYHDLIIYEMHVRGFTIDHSAGLAHAKPGTFSAITEKIPYLKELGVTAVELMPIHQYDPQENNYWGYMTLNFFSPHHSYGSDPSAQLLIEEFKKMVRALHDADIEVILDVVYNHTTEGDQWGPTYSFKGIDNSSFYLLSPNLSYYLNDAGSGNEMRTAYRAVRKLVVESLVYWFNDMHVDGFRFDLATIFTRKDNGEVNYNDPPILEEISMYPDLARARLIAEPWDTVSYQLGVQFPGTNWSQWNGQYRDDIRRFIKGDDNMVPRLMKRVYGSDDIFFEAPPYSAKPFQSINFLTCHDGFTLYDLVAYNDKHNLANGHNNTDGTDNNYSWNCGWEGDTNVPPDVVRLRKKQVRNMTTLLMFSNGIPMFRMGDEFLNTQWGNNNPYNQDNATSWLDWGRKEQFADIFRFFKTIISVRKAHPSICRGVFWQNDVHWHGVGAEADLSWTSKCLAWFLNGKSMQDDDFYVMVNAWWNPLDFVLQEGNPGEWKRIIDTNLESPDDIVDFGTALALNSPTYRVEGRSIVVLQRKLVL